MTIIIQWVTQIVIFILLAAIIDLLIPATSMKKYIKLVIGLILILIFLKPVFYLFNVDIQSELRTAYTNLYQEETNTNTIGNLIELKKKEIQAPQDAYILEQMTIQLIDLAKTPLMKNYQLEISDINFIFSDDQNINYESLDEVVVYVRESSSVEGDVDIVDEVMISSNEQPLDKEQDNEQIKILLQKVWELTNTKGKDVKWSGAKQKR